MLREDNLRQLQRVHNCYLDIGRDSHFQLLHSLLDNVHHPVIESGSQGDRPLNRNCIFLGIFRLRRRAVGCKVTSFVLSQNK